MLIRGVGYDMGGGSVVESSMLVEIPGKLRCCRVPLAGVWRAAAVGSPLELDGLLAAIVVAMLGG